MHNAVELFFDPDLVQGLCGTVRRLGAKLLALC